MCCKLGLANFGKSCAVTFGDNKISLLNWRIYGVDGKSRLPSLSECILTIGARAPIFTIFNNET
jgi:hypothetical protein